MGPFKMIGEINNMEIMVTRNLEEPNPNSKYTLKVLQVEIAEDAGREKHIKN